MAKVKRLSFRWNLFHVERQKIRILKQNSAHQKCLERKMMMMKFSRKISLKSSKAKKRISLKESKNDE